MPVSSASPCGLCYEDNRAAVYSYEAVQKAKIQPDRLEFVVLKVKGPLPDRTVTHLKEWFSKRPGIDAETVRISGLQKSIGFVLERIYSKEKLVADLVKEFSALDFKILSY